MLCNGIQTPSEEQPEPIFFEKECFLTRVEDFLEAPSNPRFCPPPSDRARPLLMRIGVHGRCWHQWPPQDGHMGCAWQAPGANFGQIQEKTSSKHIFPLTSMRTFRAFMAWWPQQTFSCDTKCLSLLWCFVVVYKHLVGKGLSTLEWLFNTFSACGGRSAWHLIKR